MTRAFGSLSSLITLLAALSACEHGTARPAQSDRTTGGGATARAVRRDSVVRALVIRGVPLVLDSTFTLDSVQHPREDNSHRAA